MAVSYRGATTFSKLWVQFLGIGYCTEQNTDGIPSFVDCSMLRNGNHTLRQKSRVVRPNLRGGSPADSPDPPVVPPWCPTSNGLKLLAKFVFKVSGFRLDTRTQTGAPLSDCRINNTLVKFTVTSR